MKRFLNVIKRNMFYIALVAGMVALVGLVALYNVKTKSEDESVVSSESTQETADAKEQTTTEAARETLGETKQTEEETEDTETTGAETTTERQTTETTEEATLDYDGSAGLIWPLNGNVIIPYSMDTTVYFETLNQYKCNPGMMIEATEDAEVVAAYKCRITEITSSAEFGNMVKASLGNGYEMIYGQLKDIHVSVNQVLEAGSQIGTVAEPSRYYTKEGTNLYFAVTKDGEPVDPIALLEGE